MSHHSEPWFYDVEDLGLPPGEQFWAWGPSDHVLNAKKRDQREIKMALRTVKKSEF
jgi:hypothetical protein